MAKRTPLPNRATLLRDATSALERHADVVLLRTAVDIHTCVCVGVGLGMDVSDLVLRLGGDRVLLLYHDSFLTADGTFGALCSERLLDEVIEWAVNVHGSERGRGRGNGTEKEQNICVGTQRSARGKESAKIEQLREQNEETR